MIKILFICHGNICRSTMAQSVMQYLVERRGLSHSFQIDSAATSREEIGKKIQEDLSGDFVSSELAVRKITEAEGVRVLRMGFEKYYWRNGSMAVTVVQIMDSGEEQWAVVAGTGGGEGILNISFGANRDYAERISKALMRMGFEVTDGEDSSVY